MAEQLDQHRMYFPQYRGGRAGIPLFEGTILDHARRVGIAINAECGGLGTCGKCVVRVERGAEALAPPTAAEQGFDLGAAERLACQATIVRPVDLYVYVVSAGNYTILSDTVRHELELDPAVTRVGNEVVWSAGDMQRSVGAYEGRICGLAIDVGTTTLVCQVLDLETGEPLATAARKNP